MSKPLPRVELAVILIIPSARIITFYATPDAASEFSEFGRLHQHPEGDYQLWVSSQ